MAALAYITPTPFALAPSSVIEGRRQRIEQAIEWLLSLLDSVEPDPDLEPSPCGSIGIFQSPACFNAVLDECEDGDTEGFEPNFATTQIEDATGEYIGARGLFLAAMTEDCEEACEDEGEPDDSGIADHGGFAEQMGESPFYNIRGIL